MSNEYSVEQEMALEESIQMPRKSVSVKEARSGIFPWPPVYKVKPLVILAVAGNVLWSGSEDEFLADPVIATGHYDEMTLSVREHDMYLNDNTKA